MTKRQRFIELISFGPSKLPIAYVLESYDLVEKEPERDDRRLPDVFTSLPGAETTSPIPAASIMGDTSRGKEGSCSMGPDSEQENADALAKLRAATDAAKKGKK